MGASQLLRTICSAAAEVGMAIVNGWTGGMDPEDFANSRFIIAWGTNLSSTNVHLMPFVREAQAKGATFVVIDPYRTRTANAADWFVQPKPGTDAALALGMANSFLRRTCTTIFWMPIRSAGTQFRERCAEYPPERAAHITGLDADEIVRLARAYATKTPSRHPPRLRPLAHGQRRRDDPRHRLPARRHRRLGQAGERPASLHQRALPAQLAQHQAARPPPFAGRRKPGEVGPPLAARHQHERDR